MWAPLDLFTKSKTSVPVLLYTTEQICVAHFFVQLFRRWHARLAEKEDLESHLQPEDADIGMTQVSRGSRDEHMNG